MNNTNKIILRVLCEDKNGLIATISNTLFQLGFNIERMKEFVDLEYNKFFMRCEAIGNPALTNDLRQQLQQKLSPNSTIEIITNSTKNVIVLATKESHCLSDILIRHYFKTTNINVQAVISNYPQLQNFTAKFDIPYHFIDHNNKTKDDFENEILSTIQKYPVDFLILAKFMRILSPNFIDAFPNKIINIHHSFLPAFIGANPYKQAFDRGVKLIGATAHIVTNNLDQGPIITQNVINVDHSYSVKDMIEAGHEVEKQVLAEAIQLYAEDKIFIHANKTILFD